MIDIHFSMLVYDSSNESISLAPALLISAFESDCQVGTFYLRIDKGIFPSALTGLVVI